MLLEAYSANALSFCVWVQRTVMWGFCLLFCFSVTGTKGYSQQTQSQPLERARRALPVDDRVADVLRIDTDLVAVDVRVTDREGRPVRNLNPQDFRLYEDNLERPISFFRIERTNGDQQPVAAVFALDVSGSMSSPEMERLRVAMSAFSSWLSERPQYCSDEFRNERPSPPIFTSDLANSTTRSIA